MADALGILDVVVTGFVNGDEGLGILDILHVEHQILGPFQLAGELDVIAGEQDAAVELVPEHTVKVGGGLVHQPQGKGVLVVDPGGQETVFPHLRGPGNTHHAQIVLQLFQHLLGLCGPGGDHHLVWRDHKVCVVRLGGFHQMLGEIRSM